MPCTAQQVHSVQRATGATYLAGAVCWIINASWSGWPSGHLMDAYLLGVTSVLGAVLFHMGAMCQLWEAFHYSRPHHAAFSPLPVSASESWLDPNQHHSSFTSGDSCTSKTSQDSETALDASHGSSSAPMGKSAAAVASVPVLGSGTGLARARSRSRVSPQATPHTVHSAQCWPGLGCDPVEQQLQHGQQDEQDEALPAGGSPRSVFNTQHPEQPSQPNTVVRIIRQCSISRATRQQQLQDRPLDDEAGPERRKHSCNSSGSGLLPACTAFTAAGVQGKDVSSCCACPPCCAWLAWLHHDRNLQAACVQVVGTSIFTAACVSGFPGVLPTNYAAGDWVLWDLLYWAPFLAGSCLFITSALLSLRDCQECWLSPKPSLGVWWVHLLNTVGSTGFWLCSFFGFFAHPAEKYQRWGMAFSCLWGSCCFALAASLQLLQTAGSS